MIKWSDDINTLYEAAKNSLAPSASHIAYANRLDELGEHNASTLARAGFHFGAQLVAIDGLEETKRSFIGVFSNPGFHELLYKLKENAR